MTIERVRYTDHDLLYAATARCTCGAGLAYPLDHDSAMKMQAWTCSAVLKAEVESEGHVSLPFVFWKVREETSINNLGRHTTRPPGTVARTIGRATCPQCAHTWESEPYSACGAAHHWFSGPCPGCGHAVGAAGSYSTADGPAIALRYRDVVIDVRGLEGP